MDSGKTPRDGNYLAKRTIPASLVNRHRKDEWRKSWKGGGTPFGGESVIPHIMTVAGRYGVATKAYSTGDEALIHSRENAGLMLNELAISECIEARMRSVSLLNWQISPMDDSLDDALREKLRAYGVGVNSKWDAEELAAKCSLILNRTPNLTKMFFALQWAIWYGRYGTQNVFRSTQIDGIGSRVIYLQNWLPIHGDKLVFRYDDGSYEYDPDQVGIRVGPGYDVQKSFKDYAGGEYKKVEATQYGLAYWLDNTERATVNVHKHIIEDGDYNRPLQAGHVHGIGIRSRIYWSWVAYEESMKLLMEYLERSALGIEIWRYPMHNPEAKKATEAAAANRGAPGRSVLMVPVPEGEQADLYDVQIVEPGLQGADVMMQVMKQLHGHKIKRYILGQTLTSEAEATGMGSGVAEAHMATYHDIITFDALGLAETLTHNLLRTIQLYNFPGSEGIWLRFKFNVEAPDMQQKLMAYQAAWEMGHEIKVDDLHSVLGSTKPTVDEDVLINPAFQQDPMMGMGMMDAGAMMGMGGADSDPMSQDMQWGMEGGQAPDGEQYSSAFGVRPVPGMHVDEYGQPYARACDSDQYSADSAGTSLHQVAALFKKVDLPKGTNLDYGGGKYDDATNYLKGKGVENLVFDPFNRDDQHNAAVMQRASQGVDSITVANVLNVLPNNEECQKVLKHVAGLAGGSTPVWFQIYEGDKSNDVHGVQRDQPTADYLPMIQQAFPSSNVVRHGNVIEVSPSTGQYAIDGDIDQYAEFQDSFNFDPKVYEGKTNKKPATRPSSDMKHTRQDGFSYTRAPEGGAESQVNGKRYVGGKLMPKPRVSPGQKSFIDQSQSVEAPLNIPKKPAITAPPSFTDDDEREQGPGRVSPRDNEFGGRDDYDDSDWSDDDWSDDDSDGPFTTGEKHEPTGMIPLFDSETEKLNKSYQGFKGDGLHWYGMRNRPPGYAHNPKGWREVWHPNDIKDREATPDELEHAQAFPNGMVAYDKPLSDDDAYSFEMTKLHTPDELADKALEEMGKYTKSYMDDEEQLDWKLKNILADSHAGRYANVDAVKSSLKSKYQNQQGIDDVFKSQQELYSAQQSFWDESDHPREKTKHDEPNLRGELVTKTPGEFAPAERRDQGSLLGEGDSLPVLEGKASPPDIASLINDPIYKPITVEKYTMKDDDGTEHHAHRVAGLEQVGSSVEASIRPEDYPRPDHDNQRLVVALGMGVDSIAMLAAMKRKGIRPDLIHWADTGSEQLHTYKAFNPVQAWCKENGFPPVVVVRRFAPEAGHRGLAEQVFNLRTLPSAAFDQNHSCSVSWKLRPQRQYDELLGWVWDGDSNPKNAIGFDADEVEGGSRRSMKAKEAIGFDADEYDSRKSGSREKGSYEMTDKDDKSGNAKYETWFPLAEWGLDRQDCVDLIRSSGLPSPGKSSCTFCPMLKKCELDTQVEQGNLPLLQAIERRYMENEEGHHERQLFKRSKGKTVAEFADSDTTESEVGLLPDQQPEVDIVDAGIKEYTPKPKSLTALGRHEYDMQKGVSNIKALERNIESALRSVSRSEKYGEKARDEGDTKKADMYARRSEKASATLDKLSDDKITTALYDKLMQSFDRMRSYDPDRLKKFETEHADDIQRFEKYNKKEGLF